MGAATNGSDAQAVAVVGAGCRLPGGLDDLGSLWDALEEGRDLVGRIPEDRFETARFVDESRPRPGKSYTAAGAFLEDVAGFDADYFGISPKEAAHMDPQHRLLLEMTAEALDDAAIDPARLAGSPTGVFVGVSDSSYGALQMMTTERITPYTASGGAHSIAANRVSHAFGLRGPSLAVDTACSSSLVALERACGQVADKGGVVLAGGVNVLIAPYPYIAFSRAAMLSAKGRCAAFSAEADGFVRAEGGGMVVLKRLSDALADGDRIHGVLAGWGSNSDGRTAGLSLPSAQAQEELLRSVYTDAGVAPDELVYMEAHGTGTPVGDPAECESIGRALARDRSRPLPVGSVKSNLGHLEPASGMAGLFKALLVLRHGRIPVSLHAEPLNTRIDFDGLGLSPAVEASTVPASGEGRRAVGVNSFGFGGANAHVIVAAPPEAATGDDGAAFDGRARAVATPLAPAENPTSSPAQNLADRKTTAPHPAEHAPAPAHGHPRLPVVVSARTPEALSAAAERMAARLSTADADEFYDLAYTACLRRGAHNHRLAVLAATPESAAEQLRAADATSAAPVAKDGRVAFVYCGNGSQWSGMGADLLADDPVFARAVAEVDACLAPYLGWSVAAEMALPREQWRLELTEVAQPLLFTVQVALTRLLAADGVTPAAAVGHSVGEAAAAWAAGALTLDQAARVVAARGRAQAPTAGSGRMAAANLSHEEADELLKGFPGVEVAGINSEGDVTLAGPEGRIKQVGDELERRGVFFRQLDLDYAFHSSAMDAVREPLLAELDGLAPAPARIPLASTATGELVEGTELDAEHWWRGIREPVLFGAAVERLRERGIGVFTEVGPHPVLRSYLRRCLGAAQESHVLTATLSRDTHGAVAADKALASLMAAGADIDWTSGHFPAPGRVTDLPAYPWQRERHWSGDKHGWAAAAAGPIDHPLLGERTSAAAPSWEGAIEPAMAPWLADHQLVGGVVFPATGYLEMALSAGRRVLDAPVEADGWEFVRPLIIPWEDPGRVRVQTLLTERDGVTSIASTEQGGEPRAHARGRVRRLVGTRPGAIDVTAARARCDRHISATDLYADLLGRGLQYGPAFQVLRDVYTGEGEVLASYRHDAPSEEYSLHPALLDGAFHSGSPLLGDLLDDAAFLPAKVGALRVWKAPPPQGWVRVLDRTRSSTELCWDIMITDEHGDVAVEVRAARFRRLTSQEQRPMALYRTVLRAAPRPELPGAPAPLPAPSRIEAGAAASIADARSGWRRKGYADAAGRFRNIIAYGLAAALAELLPGLREGGTAPADLDALELSAAHRRALDAMLAVLVRHGTARWSPESGWLLTTDVPDAAESVRHCLADLPGNMIDLVLPVHNMGRLVEVMRGDRDATEMLADAGTGDLVRQFFATSPQEVFAYRVAQSLITELAAHWPADRPLRVLEIGAGTAAFTQELLPLLPAERTRYTFTDVSPFFFAPAQKQLADYDYVDYRTLDLDTDPAEQGFTPGGYDLVLAANALHTARDLAASLPRVASLLAPGGQLLAVENHNADCALGMFGLLETFWKSTDTDLRPGAPFLTREQWPELLHRCGFTDVVQTGDDQAPAADDFSVLLAVAEHSAAPRAAHRSAGPESADPCRLVVAETPGELVLARALADTCADTEAVVAPADTAGWQTLLSGAPQTPVTLVCAETDPGDPVGETRRRAAMLRSLVAACPQGDEACPTGLTLVTRPTGAHPAPDRPEVPADAAVWGMARTLASERPDLRITRISLERSGDATADARRLASEIGDASSGPEDEVVLTAQGRFVPRLVEDIPTLSPDQAGHYELHVEDQGLNFRVHWAQAPERSPGPGMVAIDVRAAALNYRDIMHATGLLPAEAAESTFSGATLGLECSGVVTAVGAGVEEVAVGDRVMAMAPAALASRAVTFAHAVARIPEHMSFAEAATVPVAFATVHYSLEEVARLREGETVLVHGGAGAVGLAALQFARMRGASVIATAGTEVKRDFVGVLGADHVLDSRSLDFAPQVMELTGGRGVDVVLNSLAGEAMVRSLEVLAPGGRFIELGKRDIMENNPLPLRPFNDNISFSGVDLSALLARPEIHSRTWAQVVERLHGGEYRPLPHSAYSAARVQDAFAALQHSRHIGKVVVTLDDPADPGPVRASAEPPDVRLDAQGTYLVTGGLGGFGAATARHLARRGARHLALVSRRGEQAPEAPALLAELRAQGVAATAYAADCADPAAMARVLEAVEASGRTLRGIVHAAMYLDDDDFGELPDERFTAVLAPKMGGLAVLDAATRGRDLDLFWVYSSLAAHVGNIRQASYNAANLFAESVVRDRRQRGEAGLAIAWGNIADAGYVHRRGIGPLMATMGLEAITAQEACTALDHLHCDSRNWDMAGVARLNWGNARSALPSVRSARFSLVAGASGGESGSAGDEVINRLRTLPPEEAHGVLSDHLAAVLAEVLHTDRDRLDHHRRLDEYGLDSLMAAELLATINQKYNLEIPPLELLRSGGTIADLAHTMLLRIGAGSAQGPLGGDTADTAEGPGTSSADTAQAEEATMRAPAQS